MNIPLPSLIDEALEISDTLLKMIKDFKKIMMKKFLEVDEHADILKIYESGFPSSPWKIVMLKELVTPDGIVQGLQDELFYEGSHSENGYPLLLPAHIKSLRFQPDRFRYISGKSVSEKYMVQGGDIIMLQHGDEKGACAFVPFMHEDSILGCGMIRIRTDADLCEVFYIANILHFYYNTGIMKNLKEEGSGRIDPSVLSRMPVPLPPLERQKQIADFMLQLSVGMAAQENYCKEMFRIKKLIEIGEKEVNG
ncbi:MAG: restriction endonuclease subunit S [Thermodesulfobacteriota bacterium]|nr:restriction endonuclease subunit S [Thermodesulfobacteriota bacterium]